MHPHPEESTVADSSRTTLARQVDTLLAQNGDDSDMLMVLLFLLTVEVGFVPLEAGDSFVSTSEYHVANLRCLSRMPTNWKSEQNALRYFMRFQLSLCPGEVFDLLGYLLGDVLVVNFLTRTEPLVSRSDGYVADSFIREGRFQELEELSLRFKDRVAVPVKMIALNSMHVRNPSLLGLPGELHLKILSRLKFQEVCALMKTCKRMNCVARDSVIWRRFYEREYPLSFKDLTAEGAAAVDWFAEYRTKKSSELASQRCRVFDLYVI